ncbi:MAG: response regulator [Spirochaetaceae bacterium]|jgi:DNA-binding response OmpR family regulator|nr:response regulator [Spirochaetaceae bacterium]
MKQILIIDESPLFREYLRIKLTENDIDVHIGVNSLDGISKMRNLSPDLIIMDYHLSRQGCMEILQTKRTDPNAVKIPVIVMAQRIDQKKILELVPYNVKKVFTKPVKIDALFITLSEILQTPFAVDESPGIVEVHVNDNIIFIEIAQGLNRDKLDLLRFKIAELIELYEIKIPKVIVMLSDIHLTFADAPNLQKLLDVVILASRARRRYIRVLTHDAFVRQYIEGQKEYGDIEVVSNLQYAMEGLLSELDASMEYAEKKAEIIGDKILSAAPGAEGEAMQLRFDAETKPKKLDAEALKDSLQNFRIAVVDDDLIIRELIKNTFLKTGAGIHAFADGGEYLTTADQENFDLVFLDLMMPVVDGFAVLNSLRSRDIRQPVIVLSAVTQRDTVIRAFRLGVKSYLTKPLKPDDIFKKAIEILKPDF